MYFFFSSLSALKLETLNNVDLYLTNSVNCLVFSVLPYVLFTWPGLLTVYLVLQERPVVAIE